jgi:FkbM family methyltransferase
VILSKQVSFDPKLETYIYGAGGFARRLGSELVKRGVTVKGNVSFLERTEPAVVHPSQVVGPGVQIIIGVFNHFTDPIPIFLKLKEIGFVRIFSPASVHLYLGKDFDTYYLSGANESLPTNSEVESVIIRLADAESVEVLRGLHGYQTRGDLMKIRRSEIADKQYLGTTLPDPHRVDWLKGDVSFLDVGAFDGDTLRSLQAFFPSVLENCDITCIEPDEISFQALKLWCTEHKPDANLILAAAGDSPSWITFSSSGQLISTTLDSKESNVTASRLAVQSTVPVVQLDHLLDGRCITHVKMDIEGAELGALRGLVSTLTKCRPKLAISLYHKPRDMVDIPNFLFDLLPNYDWYIRCYGSHGYDTIIYGIPKQILAHSVNHE